MSCSFAAEMGKFVKSLDEQNFKPKAAITASEALNGNNELVHRESELLS